MLQNTAPFTSRVQIIIIITILLLLTEESPYVMAEHPHISSAVTENGSGMIGECVCDGMEETMGGGYVVMHYPVYRLASRNVPTSIMLIMQ